MRTITTSTANGQFAKSGRCWRRAGWLTTLILIAAVGCGRSEGPQRVIVHGEVSYEGVPVANGQIYFFPLEDTEGTVSGGPIKDGHYVAKARGGVPVGSHRVEISGFRAPAPVSGPVSEGTPPEQYLPPEFNSHSTLVAKIDGSEDPATQDFHLTK